MVFVFQAEQEGTYTLKFNRQDFIHDHIINDYVKVIVEASPESAGSAWSTTHVAPDRVYVSPRWPPAPDSAPEEAAAVTEGTGAPGGTAAGAAAAADAAAAAVDGAAADGALAPDMERPAAVSAIPPPEGLQTPGTGPVDFLPPDTSPPASGDWIRRAREEYDGGRIAGALGALDQFMIDYPGGSDEAYWLYGQSLEANNEATRDVRRALEYYRRLVREYPQSSRYDEAHRRIAYLERYYFNIH
jgi:TolA-binding protein